MKIKCNMIIKIAIWIPVIFLAFSIFGFSSQNGDESGSLSRKASGIVIDIADQIHIVKVTEENREQLISNIEYPIRKCAHMMEYAVLCSLTYLALIVDGIQRKKARYLAFAMAVAFACTDEIHQLFVPDRSGRFTDVLVDSCGCLIGLLVCYLIYRIRSRIEKRN